MKILKINTTKTRDGFRAWLNDDERVTATSRQSAYLAAENLAVMVFVGRNQIRQISEDVLSKIVVRPIDGGGYRATYDD